MASWDRPLSERTGNEAEAHEVILPVSDRLPGTIGVCVGTQTPRALAEWPLAEEETASLPDEASKTEISHGPRLSSSASGPNPRKEN